VWRLVGAEEQEESAQAKAKARKGTADTMSGAKKDAKLHYAWNSKTKERADELAAAGVDTSPKPVSDAVAAAGLLSSPQPVAVAPPTAASAWNAAGTYEEKDATPACTALLRERLLRASAPLPGGAPEMPLRLRLPRAATVTGTVTRVFARGRARLGYELELAVDWEVVEGEGERVVASGSAELKEVADSNSDVFDSSRYSVARQEAVAAAAVAALQRRNGEGDAFFRREVKDWVAAALA
jgi:hypothetical protein